MVTPPGPRMDRRFRQAFAVLSIAAVLMVSCEYVWNRSVRPANALAPPVAATTLRIDVNHADADTLNLLPGVGATLAQRIIDARQRGGPFHNVAEMSGRVSGIGAKTAKRMEPYVEFK